MRNGPYLASQHTAQLGIKTPYHAPHLLAKKMLTQSYQRRETTGGQLTSQLYRLYQVQLGIQSGLETFDLCYVLP